MALVLADRVRETTTVTGTGTATLLGAVSGYQSFSAVGNANTTYYVIANQSASEWEVGIGTYTASGTLLSRDTVLSSSNSGSLVNFSAGTKDVFVDYPAGKAVYEDAAGNVDGYPITGGAINNTTVGATTPSTGVFTTLTATGQTSLGGVAGAEGLRVLKTTSSVNFVQATGAVTGSNPAVIGQGGDTEVGLDLGIRTGGFNFIRQRIGSTGFIDFSLNAAGSPALKTNTTSGQVNYHQLTGSATGSGPIHSVAGSDTNIDLNLTAKGTGVLNLNTGAGTQVRIIDSGGTAVNRIHLQGQGTGFLPVIASRGSDTNLGMSYSTQGTGGHDFYTAGTNFTQQVKIAHTASAVNYVQVTGAATGTPVAISAQGSDSNIRMNLFSKGTESIDILTSGGAVRQARFTNTASTVNWVQMTGAVTGFGPVFSAAGSDTNIPLVLQPKGTGALQAQQTDSTATGGNARGANAVDWQTARGTAAQVANGTVAVIGGGQNNTSSGLLTTVSGGFNNNASGNSAFIGGGQYNVASQIRGVAVGGGVNTAAGIYNFVGGGFTNSGTANGSVTTQSGTMNGTTAVTLSGSNASIKVGQYITGTSIAADTYVAAISGTSLTLSQAASGSSTSTLSFFTPHGVVVGGGNNQATGAYSFIGGGGDAGTAANRNVASGDWGTIAGGRNNTASGVASFVGGGGFTGVDAGGNTASGTCATVSGGFGNTASGTGSSVTGGFQNTANSTVSIAVGGRRGTTRSIIGNTVFSGSENPIADSQGVSQAALLVLARQTTDATATVLTSNASAAGTTNQVILPNNSAYYFKVEIIANVTGGGNTSGWELKGVIKRGANAASTTIVGSVTSTLIAQDAGASTWAVSATADTTNGGLKITCTGQASTTIRWVAKASTTEVTF